MGVTRVDGKNRLRIVKTIHVKCMLPPVFARRVCLCMLFVYVCMYVQCVCMYVCVCSVYVVLGCVKYMYVTDAIQLNDTHTQQS